MNFLVQIAYGVKQIYKKDKAIFDCINKYGAIERIDGLYRLADGFVIGRIEKSKNNQVFLCTRDQDYRIRSLKVNFLQNYNIVLAQIIKTKKFEKVNILEVLKDQKNLLVFLDLYKGKIFGFDFELKKPIALPFSQKSLKQLPRYSVIEFDIKAKKIINILGNLLDPKIDEKIILSKYDHQSSFSDLALEYANSFSGDIDVKSYPHRVDLTSLPFCTIDPINARDHDDAIYYNEVEKTLYVAIADVSEYVALNSILDTEAFERGFSLYFPHKSYPMLPENLSQNVCSLLQDQPRLAFVWKICFNENYEILESHLFEAIIKNHQRLSYDEVDLFLEKKKYCVIDSVAQSIENFLKVSKILYKRRMEKGLDFQSQETEMSLDEAGYIKEIFIKKQTPSQQLIQEAMLLANIQTAKILGNVGIFRIHQQVEEDKKNKLFSKLKNIGFEIRGKNFYDQIKRIQTQATQMRLQKEVDSIIIQAQNRATYSPFPEEHFALGFQQYTHFTSPIRRYSDLFIHRLLKNILSQTNFQYFLKQSEGVCHHLNFQERKIAKMEAEFKDRKFARLAQKYRGKKVHVRITSEGYRILAQGVDEILGARIYLFNVPEEIRFFDMIEVEILESDLVRGEIFADFVSFIERKEFS